MLSRKWLAQVGGGAILAALASAWTVGALGEARERSGPPQPLRVADIGSRSPASDHVSHARLVDLAVYCNDSGMVGRHRYAAAMGTESDTLALVELDPDEPCEIVTAGTAGSVRLADRFLLRELGDPEERLVVVLRPHRAQAWMLQNVLLAVLGGLLLWSGLRTRRRGREQLEHFDRVVEVVERPTGDAYREPSGDRTLLPRPLRLNPAWWRRARRCSVLMRLGLHGLFLLLIAWAAAFSVDTHRMYSAWKDGVAAADGHVGVHERHYGGILRITDFGVDYTDANGTRHFKHYSRWALLSGVDRGEPAQVKYAPEQPARFALSWLVDGFAYELALFIAVVMLALLSLAGLALLPARDRLLLRIRNTIHAGPEEVLLDVVQVEVESFRDQVVVRRYKLRLPEGAIIAAVMAPPNRPLFLDSKESQLLGLRSREDPTFVVVLRENLAPLLADPDEPERVLQRHREARSSEPGAGPPR